MSKIIKWVEKKAKEQMTSNAGVVPSYKWNGLTRSFYLDSPAGLIQFKPKTEKDLIKFRDEFVNQFADLAEKHKISSQTNEFYSLYAEIRKKYKVKYTANLATRLKGKVCSLIQFV